MNRAAGELDAVFERLPLRLKARKGWQQRRVNVQNTVWERGHKIRRQQAHVAGETDEVDFVLVENLDDLAVIRFPFQSFRRNHARGNTACLCAIDTGGAIAVADDHGDFRVRNSAGRNALRERFEIRTAAAQQHAYALLHERKTLTQQRASAKLGLYLRPAAGASSAIGNGIAKFRPSR